MSKQKPTGVSRPPEYRFTISDKSNSVEVQKIISQGERLEIDSGDETIKLDSLLLEGLSWQREYGKLQDVIGERDDDIFSVDDDASHILEEFTISNEYSHTTVRKIETDNGEGIQIETPVRGTKINLGIETLEALTGVSDNYLFSRWFKTPFGPEDAPVEGPL